MAKRPSIGIVGPGKVGATLARLLVRVGYDVKLVYARRNSEAEWLAAYVNGDAVNTPAEVLRRCDLTLLTVSDDAIAPVSQSLTGHWQGKAVVHTSGAHDLHALDALARRGAMVGSLHPAFPFADVETAMAGLSGAAYAVEASHDLLHGWLNDLVTAIDGRVLAIPPGKKALYHAALVIASNYAVALYAASESLLVDMGADKEAVKAALDVMMAATIENLRTQGVPAALTGPLTRADIGTLKAHQAVLADQSNLPDQPELATLYVDLARLAYPMLRARGVDTDFIERHFTQGNSNHE